MDRSQSLIRRYACLAALAATLVVQACTLAGEGGHDLEGKPLSKITGPVQLEMWRGRLLVGGGNAHNNGVAIVDTANKSGTMVGRPAVAAYKGLQTGQGDAAVDAKIRQIIAANR